MTQSVLIACEVAAERALPNGGSDCDNVDVIDHVRHSERMDSLRFGVSSVDGRACHITVDGKSLVTFYGAWSRRMEQWGMAAVHQSHLKMGMSYLWDRDEWHYVKTLENFMRDNTNGTKRLSNVSSDFLLSVPYASLPFLIWSRVLHESAKNEMRHHVNSDEAYFVGWNTQEFFTIPCEQRAKFYGKVPSWWRQYEPFRALSVPKSLFSSMC